MDNPGRGSNLDTSGPAGIKHRKTHILAFAIGKYADKEWGDLRYPVQECRELLDTLIDLYDVEPKPRRVLLDEEATCENIYTELSNLHDLIDDDNLIIIFSGHGFFYEERNEGFWIPSDGRMVHEEDGHVTNPIVLKKDFISVADIVSTLKTVKAHHILLIVDSCFSGAFTRIGLPVDRPGGSEAGLPEEELPSRFVLTSGLLDKVPDKSLFARELIDLLKKSDQDEWTLDFLAANIRNRIRNRDSYSPKLESIVDAESKGGMFVIHRRKRALHAPVADDPALLGEGSLAYLHRLEQGRFRMLRISDLILPDLHDGWLDTAVTRDDGREEIPLQQAVREVARRESPHALLIGGGGTGKTTSFVRLWRQWRKKQEGPIPVFVALNEYNARKPEERENFIQQYVAENYLSGISSPLRRLQKWWFEDACEPEDPPVFLLLLDGFNEVTTDKTPLIREMQELVQKGKPLQILVTSRPDAGIEGFGWAQGFHRITLQPLDEEHIEAYLKENKIEELPRRDLFRKLLTNPFMLTLYPGTVQWTAIYGPETTDFFHFKPRITSTGELLNNFVEAQLAAYMQAVPEDETGFMRRVFLLRHLLPYLAWRMVEAGQFYFITRMAGEDDLSFGKLIMDAYDWFEEVGLFDEYPHLKPYRASLGFDIADSETAAQHARNRDIISDFTDDLFMLVLEGNSLRFLHQIFRDFFAAMHVQRTLEISLTRNRDLPPEEKTLPDTLAKPLDHPIRQLLRELVGEHYG